MSCENFCFWLQGYFEIVEANPGPGLPALTPAQTATVRRHLDLVFAKKTGVPAVPPAATPRVYPPAVPTAVWPPYTSAVGTPYVSPVGGNPIATC